MGYVLLSPSHQEAGDVPVPVAGDVNFDHLVKVVCAKFLHHFSLCN